VLVWGLELHRPHLTYTAQHHGQNESVKPTSLCTATCKIAGAAKKRKGKETYRQFNEKYYTRLPKCRGAALNEPAYSPIQLKGVYARC